MIALVHGKGNYTLPPEATNSVRSVCVELFMQNNLKIIPTRLVDIEELYLNALRKNLFS